MTSLLEVVFDGAVELGPQLGARILGLDGWVALGLFLLLSRIPVADW